MNQKAEMTLPYVKVGDYIIPTSQCLRLLATLATIDDFAESA